MSKISRLNILLSGLNGFVGVSMGAFGAHALKPTLVEAGRLETWETASLYLLIHAVAFLALAGVDSRFPSVKWGGFVSVSWLIGCLLFSGSLYILCLSGISAWGAVTPLGGIAFLSGWAGLILAAWKGAR